MLAEQLGLDGFYYGESPHDLNLDCWTTLAGLAVATERIRLGPVITNVLPKYRSLVLLAKQAATVASISHGRVDLRTGVGASAAFGRPWWQPFGINYPDYDQRFSDLVEALEMLPRLWAGETMERATDADIGETQQPQPQPRPLPEDLQIPITIAASGERAMALAARQADVWETSFCTPAEFAERNATFSALSSEQAVGHSVKPAVEHGVTRSLEIDGFVSQTTGGLDTLLNRVRAERGPSEDLDRVLERALIGLPSEVAEQLRALQAVGVEQVIVALHDPHDHDALRAIAEAASLLRSGNSSLG